MTIRLMKLVLTFFLLELIKRKSELLCYETVGNLDFGLIECLILLMMKFIKVLEGEINAESAAMSGKLIRILIPVIKGTGLLTCQP